ncbi:MAG: VanZ family protein [Pedobacter sp.]|nr:VanZ family protein [Chitinophagaceae bacterium]
MKPLRIYNFIPAFIFFLFSFLLFTIPGQKIPQLDWGNLIKVDKLVHFGLFFILLILLSFPFSKTTLHTKLRLKWFLIFTVSAIAYGIAIEFIQKYFVLNRTFSVLDIIADAVGCIAGYYCATRLFIQKNG